MDINLITFAVLSLFSLHIGNETLKNCCTIKTTNSKIFIFIIFNSKHKLKCFKCKHLQLKNHQNIFKILI